jgi:tRNA A-37 threonylcarbamoyl transferase component Bud32
MFNGDRFRATVTDNRTVTLDKLPGDNLWEHMNRGTLTLRMLKAAGSEYQRAHHFKTKELGNGWSHGDASMTNVIYDEKAHRARLIDFEIRHEKSLPAAARHTDDLLVFLLDMMGRNSEPAMAVIRDLFSARLQRCRRHPRIEETSRSSDRRGPDLVECADQFHRTLAIDSARKRRRPSISCQRTRPGMPTIKSRKRASKDMAKAVSPGMPRRLPTTR